MIPRTRQTRSPDAPLACWPEARQAHRATCKYDTVMSPSNKAAIQVSWAAVRPSGNLLLAGGAGRNETPAGKWRLRASRRCGFLNANNGSFRENTFRVARRLSAAGSMPGLHSNLPASLGGNGGAKPAGCIDKTGAGKPALSLLRKCRDRRDDGKGRVAPISPMRCPISLQSGSFQSGSLQAGVATSGHSAISRPVHPASWKKSRDRTRNRRATARRYGRAGQPPTTPSFAPACKSK